MARDDFLDNVRDAVTLPAPALETNGDPLYSAGTTLLSRRATLWLTPKTVEGYDPNDFKSLDAERRHRLDAAVHAFEKVVKRVSLDAPATDEQIHAGWEKFKDIAAIARALVRDEWTGEVARLVEEAEGWCLALGWIAKRRTKQLHDTFLGDHEARQLHFHNLDHHFLLDPIARYVVGASGLLDLSILPTCESFMVTRANGKWFIRPSYGEGKRRPWSERAFVDAVAQLSSLV